MIQMIHRHIYICFQYVVVVMIINIRMDVVRLVTVSMMNNVTNILESVQDNVQQGGKEICATYVSNIIVRHDKNCNVKMSVKLVQQCGHMLEMIIHYEA